MTQQTADNTGTVSDTELAEFVSVATSFAADVPGRLALELDEGDQAALDECWNGLSEIGFDRCLAPEEGGGAGLPLSGLLAVLEALANAEGGVAMLTLLANCAIGALPAEGQRNVAAGQRLAYLPFACVDGLGAPVFADGRLTGSTGFVLGADAADGLVVGGCEGGERVLVAIDPGAEGVTIELMDDQLGLVAAAASKVTFKDAPGERVGGADACDAAETVLSAGVAAIAHGIARRAQRLALEYAENRYQGGSMIIEYGAVRELLAQITEREVATRGAATGADWATPDLPGALARKTAVTDAAVLSTIDAVQVFGGMGYMHETGVEKLMRDAKYCQLFPTPNWHARDALLEFTRR